MEEPAQAWEGPHKYFEREQEDKKRMIRGFDTDNNTRMCQPMPGKTAVYTAQAGQQMALQSTQIAHPMGEEDRDHVNRKKRIHPTTY